MEIQGIIDKPTGPTEWLNNLVIRGKGDGWLFICLDPKYLNETIKREHHPICADAATHKQTTAVFISRYGNLLISLYAEYFSLDFRSEGFLKKVALFQWSEACGVAFQKIKNHMSENVCDRYFDTTKDVVL